MTDIQETPLPGVGVRHDFVTQIGRRIGVISHRTGERDLLIYKRDDPDACAITVRLNAEETRALAELLGGSQITKELTNLQQTVEGLTIDWLPISPDWACARRTIKDIGLSLKAKTGVSIVAVIRQGQTTPSPSLDFKLLPEDTLVVVGTVEGLRKTAAFLQAGEECPL